ncbi:hypothetical protein C9426_24885 [Serratia sp. S1B]|nr:hypothetical protein C9426_24885 [Serratia sp. S1B]
MFYKIKIVIQPLIAALCLPLMLHSALAATPDEIAQSFISSPIGAHSVCRFSYTLPLPEGKSTHIKAVLNGIVLSNDGHKVRFQIKATHTTPGDEVFMIAKYISISHDEPGNRRLKGSIESDSVQIETPSAPSAAANILPYYKSFPAYYYDYKDIKFTAPGDYIIKSKDSAVSDITCKHVVSDNDQPLMTENLPTFWLKLITKMQLARWLVL